MNHLCLLYYSLFFLFLVPSYSCIYTYGVLCNYFQQPEDELLKFLPRASSMILQNRVSDAF